MHEVVQPSLDTVQCEDGDVRLLVEEISGPVEVCVNKRWATVCGHGWSDADATVACRQLGYASGKRHYIECTISLHVFRIVE